MALGEAVVAALASRGGCAGPIVDLGAAAVDVTLPLNHLFPSSVGGLSVPGTLRLTVLVGDHACLSEPHAAALGQLRDQLEPAPDDLDRRSRILVADIAPAAAATLPVSVVAQPAMLEVLRRRESGALAELVLRAVPLRHLNPYFVNRAVPAEMFVGRRSDVNELAHGGYTYAIVGARRIGKTSLGHMVRAEATRRSRLVCELNMGALGDLNDIWYVLNKRLATEVELSDLYRARPVLGQRWITSKLSEYDVLLGILQRREPGTLIILDECDRAIRRDRANNWEVFGRLQGLLDEARVKLILIGYEGLWTALKSDSFPLNEASHRIRIKVLGSLTQGEVEQLVTQPMAALGVTVQHTEVITRMYTITGGVPHVVQHLCQQLLNDPEVAEHRTVTADDLERLAHGKVITQFAQARFAQVADPLPRLQAFLSTDREDITIDAMLQRLDRFSFMTDDREVRLAFEQLVLYGIMRQLGDAEFAFTYPILQEEVRKQATDRAVTALVQRLEASFPRRPGQGGGAQS